MSRFVLIALFAVLCSARAATVRHEVDGRIVNGEDGTIEQHPYQVSLQNNRGSHFCGGSIISERIVVTAAHCMQSYKAWEFKVRLGSTFYNSSGELVSVESFKFHEGYDSSELINDVAVIKLSTPVRQSSKVRYIALAEQAPKNGTKAVVSGWGTKCFAICTSLPTNLQTVQVSIVEKDICASSNYKYGSNIKDTMICAHETKKDSCQGDSGGPLVANNQLVGIVSWGMGCAFAGYPGVYCDVASIREWIVRNAAAL